MYNEQLLLNSKQSIFYIHMELTARLDTMNQFTYIFFHICCYKK